MCCNRSLNNKIDRLHVLPLQLVYIDKASDFNELLEKDGSVSVKYQNIRQLATEMFKVSKGLYSQIAKGFFQFRNEGPTFTFLLYERFLVVQKLLNFLALKFGNLYQMK